MRSNRTQTVVMLIAAVCLVILIYSYQTSSYNSASRKPFDRDIEETDESLNDLANRKYVYIDLGANNGDSLQNFFGISQSGGGGNLQSLLPDGLVESNKWIVHAYEANPFFDQQLARVKEQVQNQSHTIYLNTQTAAWTYDGKIDFFLDTVNPGNNFWGSSLNKNAKDVINSKQTKIQVPCHEIARIVKLYKPADIVVVKMDIEGAEYDLMIDLFRKNALRLVDYLAVEYHPALLEYKVTSSFFNQLAEIEGVELLRWS